MADFEKYLIEFNNRYSNFLSKKDSNNLHALLKEPVPEFDKNESRLVASLHQIKAGAYALFAENTEMDRHFEAAVNIINQKEVWKLYLDWSNLYLIQLRIPQMQDNPNLIFRNAIDKIKRIKTAPLNKDRYALWAVTSFQSFCEVALQENKRLPNIYHQLDYAPIPISLVNNPKKIKEFYGHFYKSIAVAIELRDETLLIKLLKMISIDDASLLSNATLLSKFQQALNDNMDLRPEFANEFNFIYALAPVLKNNFPNLNLFVSYLENQNFGGLHYFFKAIK